MLLTDRSHPARKVYLARFAEREGRRFIARYAARYRGRTPEAILARLVDGCALPTERLISLGSVHPW